MSHREPNDKSKLGGELTAYHICLNKKTELYQTTTTTNHHERRRYIVLSTSTVANHGPSTLEQCVVNLSVIYICDRTFVCQLKI